MNPQKWPASRSLDRREGQDERARPPGELLDNLRLRLSQLAGNHPSAADYSGQADVAAGGQEAESAQAGSGFDEVFGKEKAVTDAGSDPGPGRGTSGWAGDAARTTAAAVAAGLGVLATMELPGGGRQGDPYRPWFMAGEPASPWWAGQAW